LGNAAVLISQRDAERVRSVREERGNARKAERPGAPAEIIVEKPPVLAADL
jgi:hypothetical protein